MKIMNRVWMTCAVLSLSAAGAYAEGNYRDTVALFKNAGQSAGFFDKSYAYAVFPTVGEGALGVGGAHGRGHVYVHGKWVGDVTMTEVSIGLQAGGKAFSQIIFFADKRALDEFESGSFEFGADASVVAVTAGANASTSTEGSGSGVSGGMKDAVERGEYYKGMAVFAIPKGGLMGQASVAGEKFRFTPRQAS
ncbi:MAG: lipid-binding SYLF domain-containing protein [Steroidobacteraceae bacterium]